MNIPLRLPPNMPGEEDEEKEQEEGGHWQHAVKVEHIERLHEQP